MTVVLGFKKQIMASAYLKEATYDAGVTMNASNACSFLGFSKIDESWDDKITNDKGDFTAKEHGHSQEITTKGVKIALESQHCTPNDLAFIAGLMMGSITSTQDGVTGAYKHKIVPIAAESAIPSCQVEIKNGGVQYAYKGVKGSSFKLSGKSGEYLMISGELVGSGTRTTSATAFVAAITENWIKCDTGKVWTETDATISIAGTLTQGAQNISSGAGTEQSVKMRSFEFDWNNDLDVMYGFGGAGVAIDIRPKRRKGTLKATLDFAGTTDINYYLNQNVMAIEFDFKGALIAGTTYAGAQLIVPRAYVTKATLPKGGVGDILSVDYEFDIYDDGTNAAAIIETYNQKAAYLA